MSRQLCAVIVLASVFVSTPLWAAQLSRPQVEYSADSTVQTEEMTMEQRVYYTPAKERRETLTGSGDGAVQIFRYDSKVMWQLMPSEKMYMEHSMAQNKGNDPSQWDYVETVMGEEVMNGVKVTKYKTIATSTDGKKYGGFSWRTKEGISIKSDLLYKEGNEKKRMMTELKNLKISRQDPQLFDVPKDFTKIDMAGMMGGPMGREGMDPSTMRRSDTSRPPTTRPNMTTPPEDVPANPEPEPPTDDRSDMQKASGMLKKLFGQ
jgi:Domain of unknown function (DUF4412)